MISERQYREEVGKRLRLLRTAMEKSQEELAVKLGYGDTTISNYENGDRKLNPYDAFKLKLAFGAPLEWLLGGDESVIPPSLAKKLEVGAQKIAEEDQAAAERLRKRRKPAARRA